MLRDFRKIDVDSISNDLFDKTGNYPNKIKMGEASVVLAAELTTNDDPVIAEMIIHGINSWKSSIRMFWVNLFRKPESRSNFRFFLSFSMPIFFM